MKPTKEMIDAARQAIDEAYNGTKDVTFEESIEAALTAALANVKVVPREITLKMREAGINALVKCEKDKIARTGEQCVRLIHEAMWDD